MKIEDLILLSQTPGRRPAREPGTENFAEYLKEAKASSRSEQSGQAAGLDPVKEVTSADEVIQTSAALADAALSRLEIFQTTLGKGDISLKKMAPLVQKLEQDCLRLQDVARSLQEDSPLRLLLEETAALAWTEAFKFQRGDYV
uniref:Uncharacterized protein n=1 Tax=Desulfobacca acetoxidans TaxID=60893 RepID=A0A7C3WS04_9BACT